MLLPKDDPIVICDGIRTPIGHVAKSLGEASPVELMSQTVKALLKKLNLNAAAVENIVVGWTGQDVSAPNMARVCALKSGLREEIPGFTVQCNCVSSIESVASAARVILAGEANVVIAGGVESMSLFPYTIQGSRAHKALRSLATIKNNWSTLWQAEGVTIGDTVELGLTDPVKKVNMAGTAEICAQMYDISRQAQDEYAHETFKRCIEAQDRGFYGTHTFPVALGSGATFSQDEYPQLRRGLIEKPALIFKAPVLFDSPAFTLKDFYTQFGSYIEGKGYQNGNTKATVTLFNSCPRSDGAAAVVVARLSQAKKLGLPVAATLASWGFYGNNPAHMGVGPAYATNLALERAGLKFDALDQIELHEPFAATVLSIFKLGRQKYGHDWEKKWKQKSLNPNGSSLSLGHPLGATGIRLLLNLIYAFKETPQAQHGLITACAGGGIGGAMILKNGT